VRGEGRRLVSLELLEVLVLAVLEGCGRDGFEGRNPPPSEMKDIVEIRFGDLWGETVATKENEDVEEKEEEDCEY
jgi:hypothetical protein